MYTCLFIKAVVRKTSCLHSSYYQYLFSCRTSDTLHLRVIGHDSAPTDVFHWCLICLILFTFDLFYLKNHVRFGEVPVVYAQFKSYWLTTKLIWNDECVYFLCVPVSGCCHHKRFGPENYRCDVSTAPLNMFFHFSKRIIDSVHWQECVTRACITCSFSLSIVLVSFVGDFLWLRNPRNCIFH